METLYDVLSNDEPAQTKPLTQTPSLDAYLTRLSTLSLSELTNNEPASLSQSSQSHLRNLQALSKRSHKAIIASSQQLESLTTILPSISTKSQELQDNLPSLESAASQFAAKYERNTENAVLDRRKRALLLSRNADRMSDVLDLPSLLSASVSSAQAIEATSTSSAATSYSAALDLSAHVKRLATLYPQSTIVSEISEQAEAEVQNLRSILIKSLQNASLKLAGAMRIIGWLRRLTPELAQDGNKSSTSTSVDGYGATDGGLAALFLICRLRTLYQTLEALEPLRELAEQETTRRTTAGNASTKRQPDSALGTQSERYIKRYIEIFREQSFNIIGMYRSIFPGGLPDFEHRDSGERNETELLQPLPSPIVSFATHLVEMLGTVLKQYMPNVSDKSARESLLTQVLYCAGSLGRLGAEFGMFIALLEGQLSATLHETAEPEWAQVMHKHRIQASRLEVLSRGVGTSRKISGEVPTMPRTPA